VPGKRCWPGGRKRKRYNEIRGPGASRRPPRFTHRASALRWQVNGDYEVPDLHADSDFAVYPADGNCHCRSLLSGLVRLQPDRAGLQSLRPV